MLKSANDNVCKALDRLVVLETLVRIEMKDCVFIDSWHTASVAEHVDSPAADATVRKNTNGMNDLRMFPTVER